MAAYTDLVHWLDERLTAAGDHGIIVMDGDGTDPGYRAAHRQLRLATRSLIEDPSFHGSGVNQWVQLADLVAFTAYMHLAHAPGKERTWHWWADYLASSSVTGADPLTVPG